MQNALVPQQPDALRRPPNELAPNTQPTEDNGKKGKDGKNKGMPRALPPKPKSADMKEEMDYLAHQRLLKDRSMRRKMEKMQHDKEMQHPGMLPTQPHFKPPVPKRDQVDPVTGQPLLDGDDMMTYMKKQRLAKEKEMLQKERENPNYKPLSPTAHRPTAVPKKDRKKLRDAEERKRQAQGDPDDRLTKDHSLFDQINKEKILREMQKREADPNYEPLSPTAHPKKKPSSKHPHEEQKEDSMFEQMRRRRLEHE